MTTVQFASLTFFGGFFAALLANIMFRLGSIASELRRRNQIEEYRADRERADRLERKLRGEL